MTIKPTNDSAVSTAAEPKAPQAAEHQAAEPTNVVQFCRARFTPEDLDAFAAVADLKLRDGHWAGVMRESDRNHDRLLVLLPEVDRPVFRFERDSRGRYSLSFHDRSGWYGIGAGDSAGECLSIWRPRGRAARQR
ncbi:hypothetical protein [Azospirillum picis]|uniref:Uncharacterized protein n=1 Tax=Azospirillum picis TaxID=488438 RepID=A0ABU0MQE1_9PROT|nr:hypothetical protein [Azospirillum picis]MBP2301504.1 hypothetical protein [Azospirillum picis]MDQ0535336.1 hypothetical protein [Azospirillum picis]